MRRKLGDIENRKRWSNMCQRPRINKKENKRGTLKIFNEIMNENCPVMMKNIKPSILGISSYLKQNK